MNIQASIKNFETNFRDGGLAMILRYASYDLICEAKDRNIQLDKNEFIAVAQELGYNPATARIQFNHSLKDYAALEEL